MLRLAPHTRGNSKPHKKLTFCFRVRKPHQHSAIPLFFSLSKSFKSRVSKQDWESWGWSWVVELLLSKCGLNIEHCSYHCQCSRKLLSHSTGQESDRTGYLGPLPSPFRVKSQSIFPSQMLTVLFAASWSSAELSSSELGPKCWFINKVSMSLYFLTATRDLSEFFHYLPQDHLFNLRWSD